MIGAFRAHKPTETDSGEYVVQQRLYKNTETVCVAASKPLILSADGNTHNLCLYHSAAGVCKIAVTEVHYLRDGPHWNKIMYT